MVPILWIPNFLFFYFQMTEFTLYYHFILFLGVMSWTLLEYTLHRFLFHSEDYWLPNNPKILAHHFMVHGIHHAFPQDRNRVVFPVILAYVLQFSVVIAPSKILLPTDWQFSFISGVTLAYIAYDMMHYFVHHSNPKNGYVKSMKTYHMQHHYKNGLGAFGVSSKFWDVVFNTKL